MGKFDYPDPGQDPAYCNGFGRTSLFAREWLCLACGGAYIEPPYPLSYWPYCSRRCELRSGDTRRATVQRRDYFELAVELARRMERPNEDAQ